LAVPKMTASPIADLLEDALALHRRGAVAEAAARYAEVLRTEPGNADAHYYLAMIACQSGRFSEGADLACKALAGDPQHARAHVVLGRALSALGRREEALASFECAIAIAPKLAQAHSHRADVLSELGRQAEAIECYDQALALAPDSAEDWFNRGLALIASSRSEEAVASFDRAIAGKPDYAEAWLRRGNVLHGLRRHDDALAAYERAIALKSDLADAWLGHGLVLADLNRTDAALSEIDRGLTQRPDFAEGWLGRGMVLHGQKRFGEALDAYDRALALKPDLAEAWYAHGCTSFEISRVADALASYDKALSIKPGLSDALSSKIFALDFANDAGFAEQQLARKEWRQIVDTNLAARPPSRHTNSREPGRRIKVGYVSSDFRAHSAAHAFRPVLLNHDKSQSDITCYSCSHARDEMTKDFQAAADRWRDVSQLSDDALYEQIRDDKIDILVDLSGHSAGNRLGVFARKPSPIQVSAWGHATGTGLPAIDYLFADPVVCPPSVRHLFAEKIFDLPCIISIEPPPQAVRRSSLPLLSRGKITFGVFNRASKVSDEAVELWARILQSIPDSRILMKHGGFDVESARIGCIERFARHGISSERIAFRGETSRRDHLAAFSEVDISLDPFPMGGGISTWESLQMGVPVVAKLGNSIVSRVGGAIVSSIGMVDWVSDTAGGYLDIAVKFASLPEPLVALRRELPAMILRSAAGNSVTYTRAVEAAYRSMWTGYRRSASS
jgi:predicted O-linked N-acetylglucosamine transferase (SPINDLY family)